MKLRFIREAQSASSLQHSNICTIHEIDETESRRILNFLITKSKQTYIWPSTIAFIYSGLREHENALKWLEKEEIQNLGWILLGNVDPFYDLLNEYQRFRKIVNKAFNVESATN